MCRHSPETGYLTMSPGLWVRLYMLATKSKQAERVVKAIEWVTYSGNRGPHFDAQEGDLIYAFMVYSLVGKSIQEKGRFQFAVWSNIDPTLDEFQGGARDWPRDTQRDPEDHHREVLMLPAFVRCMQGHSLVGASDERAGVVLSFEQCSEIGFAWHGTDANNIKSILASGLRGTYVKQWKDMKSRRKAT